MVQFVFVFHSVFGHYLELQLDALITTGHTVVFIAVFILGLLLFIFFLLLYFEPPLDAHIRSGHTVFFIAVFILDLLLFIFFSLLFCSPSRFLDALITTSRTVSSSRSSNKATTCFSLFFHFCQHTLIQ